MLHCPRSIEALGATCVLFVGFNGPATTTLNDNNDYNVLTQSSLGRVPQKRSTKQIKKKPAPTAADASVAPQLPTAASKTCRRPQGNFCTRALSASTLTGVMQADHMSHVTTRPGVKLVRCLVSFDDALARQAREGAAGARRAGVRKHRRWA